ncbi:MAG TPA: NAD(P)H-hydrate dehydratase [Clostridia bacterium]|nr:NAD(P)H-hydrate dehydratase [Clostridia bacterium]
MYLVTKEEMALLDKEAIEEYGIPGLVLMENAALRVAEYAGTLFPGGLARKKVLVFAGKGNNGGDGLAIARHLQKAGADVKVFLLCRPEELKGDALVNYRILVKMQGRFHLLLEEKDVQKADISLMCTDLVVDAIYGTGFKGKATGTGARIIGAINGSSCPVIAVDVPSGLDADTGIAGGPAIQADATITFGYPKIGLCLETTSSSVGELWVGDISLPQDLPKKAKKHLITAQWCSAHLPARNLTAHKGTFGHVLAVGGSEGLTGAISLAAAAALRSGAGLVTAAVPKSLHPIMEMKTTEIMTKPLPETEAGSIGLEGLEAILSLGKKASCILLGPGMSEHPSTASLIRSLLPKLTQPLVLDADALNIVSETPEMLASLQAPLVLTPHPGEMGRLLGISSREVQQNRVQVVREASRQWGAVVVLKGARTLIGDPRGELLVNMTGNPGMATGGSGDVLAGMIAGLMGQGLDPLVAAGIGVYAHGAAGDRAASVKGLMSLCAGDLLDYLPPVFLDLEGKTHPLWKRINDRLVRVFPSSLNYQGL